MMLLFAVTAKLWRELVKLLTKATYENHAMHHLLPSSKSACYNLRSHGYGLPVSFVKSELHKNIYQQSFILWVLSDSFLLSYWFFCVSLVVFRFSFYCLHVLCYSRWILTSRVCRGVFYAHSNYNVDSNGSDKPHLRRCTDWSLVFARLCQCEPHPIHDCLGPCESAPKRHRDQFCCVYTAHTVVTNIQTRNIGKCVATGFVLAIWHNTVNEYGGSDEIGCCEMNQLLQH